MSGRNRLFTAAMPSPVRIGRMLSNLFRSLVGDIETEYDEFDRDTENEVANSVVGWLEPSW